MSTQCLLLVRPQRALLAAVVGVFLGVALSGCGDVRKKDKTGQPAARVNQHELTTQQVSFMLQQQRGLKPEQEDAASRQILERLIDQELAIQKAEELKLDRDPRVLQQIDAARREIIARAYVERMGEGIAKPSPDEVQKYFEDTPALFRERRIYTIQEIGIEAKPEQVAELRAQLQAAKSGDEFIAYLKANDFRFAGGQAVRGAEQLPMTMLESIARMKDGQAMLVPTANGAQVIVLAASRPAPVDLNAARPAIEQHLIGERRRELVQKDLKSMRAAATIEYVGKFAPGPASSGASSPGAAGAASSALPASAPR